MADRPTFLDHPPVTEPAPLLTPTTLPASLPRVDSVLLSRMKKTQGSSENTRTEPELPVAYLEGQQRGKLIRWTYLEPTETLQARLDRAIERFQESQTKLLSPYVVHTRRQAVMTAQDIVADATERDETAIAMNRPEGCWCFGLGGRDQAVVAIAPEDAEPLGQWEYRLKGNTGNTPVAVHREEVVFGVCCPYCSEGQEAAERKDEIARPLRMGARILPAHGWVHSGIPIGFQGFRLETWPNDDNRDLIAALSQAGPASWCFRGEVGRGKTGLAVGLAWKWREERTIAAVLFVTLPSLMQEIKSSYNRRNDKELTEDEVIEKYAWAPFLIMDDMGAEHTSGTGWSDDKLYQIIASRHANGQPTIFTSNKTAMEMVDLLGDRIYDRIMEMTNPDRMVLVTGPNLRQLKVPRRTRK